MSSGDLQLERLGAPARNAGELLTEHVEQIATRAERQAEEIQREAERDAKATRRGALEAARRVLERINALESPLSELVGTLKAEVDRVAAELDGTGESGFAESSERDDAEAEVPAPESLEPEGGLESEPSLVGATPREASATVTDADVVHPDDLGELLVSHSPESAATKRTRRKRRSRLFSRRSPPFISEPGDCAVCQRSFQAGDDELAADGWSVSGDCGLCPDCQSDGWQLPGGGRLPFRRARTETGQSTVARPP